MSVTPGPRDEVWTSATARRRGALALSFDRGPDTRLLLARVDADGALLLDRYDDTYPPAVAATVTVEASGCSAVSLIARGNSRWLLGYVKGAGPAVVYLRESQDQGGSWSVADTVASGYAAVSLWGEETRVLAAVYEDAADAWKLSVGTLDAAGAVRTWTTPQPLVGSAKGSGDLRRTSAGVWEFAYVDTGDVVRIVRTGDLPNTGIATWS